MDCTAWSCPKASGERWPRAEYRQCGFYQPSRYRKTASRASACVAKRYFARHSTASSAIELSYASPREPIDGRTPSGLQRCPKASARYWADSTGRRNTFDQEVDHDGGTALHRSNV
jgi:hypothetical protein